MLQTLFTQLIQNTTADESTAVSLWPEIEKHYTSARRHYHNLQHLQNMYEQLQAVKIKIDDWDTLLFSLFYHDVIYSPTATDNEEKSAELAEKRLKQINYPPEKIEKYIQQILATKKHTPADSDTNYFTDADLSILGADWPAYEAYTKAIRKEYSIFPDLLYKPGRRKVLQHFLGMEKIYKTNFFKGQYEAAARENMQKELKNLS